MGTGAQRVLSRCSSQRVSGSTGSNRQEGTEPGWERGREPTREPASWHSVLAGGTFLTGQTRLPGSSAAAARAALRASPRVAPPAPARPGSGARGEGKEGEGKAQVRGHPKAPRAPPRLLDVPSGRDGGEER